MPISPYVSKWLGRLDLVGPMAVLDIPAGAGRHSLWLSELGHEVVAVDIDSARLGQARAREPDQLTGQAPLKCVVATAEEPLPFKAASFDLAVVVHYVSEALLGHLVPVLRPAGHLIYESFGGQGANWMSLPQRGSIRDLLSGHYDLIDYQERPVGPPAERAVVVKCVARRSA